MSCAGFRRINFQWYAPMGACENKYFSLDLIFGFKYLCTEPSCTVYCTCTYMSCTCNQMSCKVPVHVHTHVHVVHVMHILYI